MGRARELGHVRLLLQDPECHGVVLVGPAGVGKTRLCREILHLTDAGEEAGPWLVATRATQGIHFGALAHLLPGELPDPNDPLELLRWGQEALAELAASAGGVLVVDDVHLLDELSAAAVQRLTVDGSVFAALTVREGEQLPEPLIGLGDSTQVERLELQPLDRSAVDELVDTVLGGPVEGRTRHQLWRLSRGNPLFLRELVLGARESGILTQRAGVWRHEGSLAGFKRVREVIEARLGHLTAPQRDALEVLAVAEPVGVELLEQATNDAAVEQLEERQLVEVWRDGRRLNARTAHPLYGEVVAEALPQLRLRRICGRLADRLERCGYRRREDLLRLASWRLESGAPSDPNVLVRAARHAQMVSDHELAEQLARAAHGQGGGFDASLTLAEAIAGQGRLDEAEQLAAELADKAATDLDRTRAALVRANLLVFQRGDPQVLEMLDQTAARVSDPACRDELNAMLVFAASYLGDLPRAIEGGRRFLAHDNPSSGALVRALVVYTYARPLMAQYEGLQEEIDHGLEAARAQPDAFPLAEDLLLANKGFALRTSGQLDAAETLARQRYERAVAQDARDLQGLWATQVAHTLDVRGHAQAAARYYDEAIALLSERDPVGMRLLVLALATYAAALIGDRRRARQLFDDYHDHASGRVPAFGTVWEARARTWLTYLDGDLPEAAEQARQAGEIGLKENLLWFAAVSFHDAVRFGYPETVADSLETLQADTEGDLIPLLAAHAHALASGDERQLQAVATGFGTMSLDLYAAEATAQAAHLHEAASSPAYRRVRSRAAQLAERCPGVSTPWLWLQRPERLTPREFEVANMAARGLTNLDISRRLGISPRTVGNHLASTYSKLGAPGRRDLAALLDIDQA